jgi:tripartite-type tricarboxylate transporter receptor subunit TctC
MKKVLILAAALIATVTTGVSAQNFPDKPVRIILPFPTATGPDTVMRLVGERLATIWGQQVVVENRPGGNGFIAMDAAKRATPDGYTLVQADAPPMTMQPYLFKKLPFDPVKDFEPVSGLFRGYFYVTVAADSKWNTVGDLIAAAKAKPGSLNYGSSGSGGNLHMGGAMLEKAAGIKMMHVPYKETAQIYMDISKGDLDWAMGTGSTTMPLFKANKIKYLAIAAPKRSTLYPAVPTMTEANGPSNFELQTWVSLFAPRGVPKAIISKINQDVAKVLQDPAVRSRIDSMGFEPLIQTPDEMQKLMSSDSAKYGALIRELNISLD